MKLHCKVKLNTDNIYAFLEDYFFKLTPATYTEDGEKQCGEGKSRSFDDIKALIDNYFDNVTDEEISLALMTLLNEPNCLRFVPCGYIKKLAFYHAKKNHSYDLMYILENTKEKFNWLQGYDINDLEKISGLSLKKYYKYNYTTPFDKSKELLLSTNPDTFELSSIKNKRTPQEELVAVETNKKEDIAEDPDYPF